MHRHKGGTKQRPKYATEGTCSKLQGFMEKEGSGNMVMNLGNYKGRKTVIGNHCSFVLFSILCNRAIRKQQMTRNYCIQQTET